MSSGHSISLVLTIGNHAEQQGTFLVGRTLNRLMEGVPSRYLQPSLDEYALVASVLDIGELRLRIFSFFYL